MTETKVTEQLGKSILISPIPDPAAPSSDDKKDGSKETKEVKEAKEACHGKCFTKNPDGSITKIECSEKCELVTCPNELICGAKYPKWISLKCGGLCMSCAHNFGKSLNIVKGDAVCPTCHHESTFLISTDKCGHTLCISCYHHHHGSTGELPDGFITFLNKKDEELSKKLGKPANIRCPICNSLAV